VSRIRLPNGDDHPEAAGKHLSDASVLLEAGRNTGRADGAAYLSGYVVECALKCLVILDRAPSIGIEAAGEQARRFRHDLGALSREALSLAALPGSRTARYVPRVTSGHPFYDRTTGWSETLRYRAPGAPVFQEAESWLTEARAVYESTVAVMRIDGVV